MNVEEKETITIEEYKAWLTGLMYGLGHDEPTKETVGMIATMTNKVVEKSVVPYNPGTFIPPNIGEKYPWWTNQPTCGSNGTDGDNTTFGEPVSICGGSTAYQAVEMQHTIPNAVMIGSITGPYGCSNFGADDYAGSFSDVLIAAPATAISKPWTITTQGASDILNQIRERSNKEATPTSTSKIAMKERLAKAKTKRRLPE